MRVLVCLSFLIFFAACGKKSDPSIPTYDRLKNIKDAPTPLQKAGEAIVKISFDETSGTGAFISDDGALLTNYHVADSCAFEGCHVSLHLNFQLAKPYEQPVVVFAEPTRADPKSDTSVLQIWKDQTKTVKWKPPHFLKFAPMTGTQLLKQAVFLVGHPYGSVKKWAQGLVFREQGDWIYSDLPSLPGSSGSPYLNESGQIIGLNHRGSSDRASLGKKDQKWTAVGTASARLADIADKPQSPSAFYHLEERHSVEEIVEHRSTYLAAQKVKAVLPTGLPIDMLDALGQQCDHALKKVKFEMIDEADKLLAPCEGAIAWIDCFRKDATTAHYRSCPVGPAKIQWRERLVKLAEISAQYHSPRALGRALVPSYLDDNVADSVKSKQILLQNYLTAFSPTVGFELAYYHLNAFGADVMYAGNNMFDFVSSYREKVGYEYEYSWIISSQLLSYQRGYISYEDLGGRFQQMFDDENLSIGNRLELESVAYPMQFLR